MRLRVVAAAVLAAVASRGFVAAGNAAENNATLTAVPGIKVGHHTLTERPTGCTVVLAEAGATAGVDVRGAAPATRETDLLEPVDLVDKIHAVVLSGGSAFGLDSAGGVMRYLEEKNIGFAFGGAHVPTVPGASLFDLPVGNPRIRPTADCGYRASQSATSDPVAEGSVGAGAGATIGKSAGMAHGMKGGIGTAAITLPDGLIVAALVAVNAAGDIIDPATGQVVAGARADDGKTFLDARKLMRAGVPRPVGPRENTTLGIIATNATLTKTQAKRVAQMAHDGFARAIYPSHTSGDGDTIFALATGVKPDTPGAPGPSSADETSRIGSLAALAMSDAILRAVRQATGVPGFPALRDLK
jgi:L-aminopeptidase/D-esterase-like protein